MQSFCWEELQRGRGFAVDPNLPRWICQNCRHPLFLLGVDSFADNFLSDHPSPRSGMHGSSIHVTKSASGSTRMDNSFVILPKQRPPQAPPGIPLPVAASHIQSDASTSPSGKAMDESFVVVYKNESPTDGGGSLLPFFDGGRGIPLQPNNFGFNSTINTLERAFEIATSQSQVEQQLCLECMRVLADKIDEEVEDVNMDIEAYEACLQRLAGKTHDVPSEADFLKKKLKIEEEERKLKAAIEETDRQFQELTVELKELDLKSSRFKELEERYWHEFNNFQFQLMVHQEQRDAILAKIDVSQSHLELLKRTSVLKDAFPIAHDGDLGK